MFHIRTWQGAIKIIISTFAATIMKIGYGITVQESDDPYILIAEEAMNGLNEAGIPGSFLVEQSNLAVAVVRARDREEQASR